MVWLRDVQLVLVFTAPPQPCSPDGLLSLAGASGVAKPPFWGHFSLLFPMAGRGQGPAPIPLWDTGKVAWHWDSATVIVLLRVPGSRSP